MIHWLKSLYLWLLPPGLFVLVCGWAAWHWRREQALRRFAVGLALLVWLLSMPAFSGLLIGWLESRHEVSKQIHGDVVVLLAGGAIAGNPDVDGMDTLTGDMANRTLTAIRLAKKYDLPLLYTGGNLFDGDPKQWEVVQRYAISLGMAPEKILLETKSLNTTQSMRMIQPILKKQQWQRPIVVTSAYHMPRSMEIFRLAGLAAQAWPCDFRQNWGKPLTYFDFMPSAGALDDTATALKEFLGLLSLKTAYRNW